MLSNFKLFLPCLLLLSAQSCMTDYEVEPDNNIYYFMHGIVYSDTNSVIYLQRTINQKAFIYPNGTVWIETSTGERFEFDLIKETFYRCRRKNLPEADYYTVHAEIPEYGEMTSKITLPEQHIFIDSLHKNGDSLKMYYHQTKSDEVGMVKVSVMVTNESIRDTSLISLGLYSLTLRKIRYQTIESTHIMTIDAFADSSFYSQQPYLPLFFHNGYSKPYFFQLLEMDHQTLEYAMKLASKDESESTFESILSMLPPIQMPDNVENGEGFVAGARSQLIPIK